MEKIEKNFQSGINRYMVGCKCDPFVDIFSWALEN